jgi:c-di-GMP-binding flagellar brake protein YcgR
MRAGETMAKRGGNSEMVTDRRIEKRTYFEPYDSVNFLDLSLEGKHYRFKILDMGGGGMGMLVEQGQTDTLQALGVGNVIEMKYCNEQKALDMYFTVRHVTPIVGGPFDGHYKVGLSMSLNPG